MDDGQEENVRACGNVHGGVLQCSISLFRLFRIVFFACGWAIAAMAAKRQSMQAGKGPEYVAS
jgi:hypothetical protein